MPKQGHKWGYSPLGTLDSINLDGIVERESFANHKLFPGTFEILGHFLNGFQRTGGHVTKIHSSGGFIDRTSARFLEIVLDRRGRTLGHAQSPIQAQGI